ncbi:helix-turn-helix domain-containing protein [Streptomyces spongiae]|uniref:Helix-turn-helix domain-containing protein n=1 Tax=Streptomyces spongiae TaxID=565072 RepID=A0A5N8XEY5_9ACTN|nr:helix-turn-helix domain-containing protein [Streptomyces spongiae]MPY57999.1 helix-turn-helix domain-containing protein [Streptomyces spongiae]
MLRARRQEAGRTIASVAVDAGLSVPYIANLENGRGNPTLSALQQLAAALGTRLEVGLLSDEEDKGEPEVPDAVRRLMESPRTLAVTHLLARRSRRHASLVTERLQEALLALGTVVGGELGERDLDRVLDVLLLSQAELDDER